MAKCCWCKKSGLLLTVNRYGFCKPCSDAVRGQIKGMLEQVQAAAQSVGAARDRQALIQLTPQLEKAMQAIRDLEMLRPRVPFFKSDLAEYARVISSGLEQAAGKIPFAPAETGHGSAIEKAMEQVWSADTAVGKRIKGGGPEDGGHLDFPLTAEGLVPAYFFEAVPVASAFVPPAGQLWDRVIFEQDPQSGDDPDTVRVYQAGRKLGCLPAGPVRKMVNAWLDRELPVLARISQTGGELQPPKLEVCFYDQPKKSGFRFFSLRFSGDGQQEQENLLAAEHWQPVTFRWLPQEEQYAVYGQDEQELGCLPQEAEALLESGEPFAFLYQVEKTASGQCAATVAIERQRRRWLK